MENLRRQCLEHYSPTPRVVITRNSKFCYEQTVSIWRYLSSSSNSMANPEKRELNTSHTWIRWLSENICHVNQLNNTWNMTWRDLRIFKYLHFFIFVQNLQSFSLPTNYINVLCFMDLILYCNNDIFLVTIGNVVGLRKILLYYNTNFVL